MGVLTNHHNESLGPADADTQVAGNRSIRYLIWAVLLLLHRAVTSITTVIPQTLLERIQLLLVLAVMTDKNVMLFCHII